MTMVVVKRCKDCVAEGVDPKGARKLAVDQHGRLRPGPRCVTHWRARKRELRTAAHNRRLEKNFELTPEQYWALYALQGGKCFGCGYATGKAKRLAVDHDHELALEHGHPPEKGCVRCVRALLCGQCNQIIGRLGVEALQRLILVLTDPPARRWLAIPPTMDGVTVDDAMEPEMAEALDGARPPWFDPGLENLG